MYIKCIVEYGTPEYHQTIHLRDLILRKPLNLEFTLEQLSEEYDSIHIGIYDEDTQLLGCLVMKPLSDTLVKMRQVAILSDYQSKGVGTALVKFAEVYVKQLGYKSIELNARDTAVPFYQKLDYSKVGPEFEEVGLKHFRFEKQI